MPRKATNEPLDIIDKVATGKRIRELAIRNNLSRKKLAAALHISEDSIKNYYRGRALPRIEGFAVLATICGVTIGDLLVLKEETNEKL